MGANQSINIPRRGGEIVPGFVAIFPTDLIGGTHSMRRVGNYPLTGFWKDNIKSLILAPNTLVKIMYLTVNRSTNKAFELNVSFLNPNIAPVYMLQEGNGIQEGFSYVNIDFWTITSLFFVILLLAYLFYNY